MVRFDPIANGSQTGSLSKFNAWLIMIKTK